MTSRNNKRDFTKGAILPHVFRMAIPMTIGIGSIISFSLVDTYFIGLLGATELAAIGYTFPVTTLFFNMIFGMAIAMSAVVSRKIGAGKLEEVKTIVTVGITITILFSSFLSILGYLMMDPIFNGLGAGIDVMPIINDYMPVWFVGAVFLAVPVVVNSAIRGLGDAIFPAVIMVMVAVINIILDPILIFGLFGVPRMEVQGAAIASMISYIIAAVTALFIIIVREKMIDPKTIFAKSCWSLGAKSLLVIAIPVSLANVITPIVSYGYTAILSLLGDEAVAGFGVATRFEAFILIPIMALAGGIAPFIGQNYGAGLMGRVNEVMRMALKFSCVYGVGSALVLAFLSKGLANAFSQNPIVHGFIADYLLYVPISFVGLNIFLVVTSSMNAMEQPKKALVLNLMRSFLVALPVAYLFVNLYEYNGFFLSIFVTNIASLLAAVYCLKTLDCFQRLKTIP